MKIEKLTISGFKNLQEVTADFLHSGGAVVLIGPNGSGKSNLIEAIATIFSDLALHKTTHFNYEITYTIKSFGVRITHTFGQRSKTMYTVRTEGELQYRPVTSKSFFEGETLLPHTVFGYYSGTRTNLANIFSEHEDAFYRVARGLGTSGASQHLMADPGQLRPFFFGRLANAPLVLLTHYRDEELEFGSFLRDHIQIDDFDSALLTLRCPEWFLKHPSKSSAEFPWDIPGSLDNDIGLLLMTAWSASLLPIATEISEKSGRTRRSSSSDKAFIFIPDKKTLRGIDVNARGQRFFTLLEALFVLDILEEVRVWINRNGVKEEISSKEISDGEKQLLTIVGLLNLTAGDETLFLLDEPDTHLNPAWKWDFLKTIMKYGDSSKNSQIIMTSHDPLTVAGLKREDVQVIYKDHATGKTEISHPAVDPQGLGVAGVLRQIFGLRTTLDPETQALIDERNRLLAEKSQSVEIQSELHQINAKLDALGLAYQSRDPEYDTFLRQKHQEVQEESVLYTPEQVVAQNNLVRDLIKKMQ